MKRLYLGTNTKMTKNCAETVAYIKVMRKLLGEQQEEMTLFVIPSFTALEGAKKALAGSSILLGAQNMCWEDRGAFTGEISPLMLQEMGVELVEIGHSERRHLFGETDEQINKKILCALRHQMKALLCIGETKEQKQLGLTDRLLEYQLAEGLKGVTCESVSNVWIAYEPVWAIGENGMPPETGHVDERHKQIRSILCSLFGRSGKEIPVLYGGSVNSENAAELISLQEVNGLFVGRSAWKAESFYRIINAVYNSSQNR